MPRIVKSTAVFVATLSNRALGFDLRYATAVVRARGRFALVIASEWTDLAWARTKIDACQLVIDFVRALEMLTSGTSFLATVAAYCRGERISKNSLRNRLRASSRVAAFTLTLVAPAVITRYYLTSLLASAFANQGQ